MIESKLNTLKCKKSTSNVVSVSPRSNPQRQFGVEKHEVTEIRVKKRVIIWDKKINKKSASSLYSFIVLYFGSQNVINHFSDLSIYIDVILTPYTLK